MKRISIGDPVTITTEIHPTQLAELRVNESPA